MSHRWMTLCVRGKTTEYCFEVWADEKFLEEWRGQGLDINPITGTVPQWVQKIGLTRIWLRLQKWGFIRMV